MSGQTITINMGAVTGAAFDAVLQDFNGGAALTLTVASGTWPVGSGQTANLVATGTFLGVAWNQIQVTLQVVEENSYSLAVLGFGDPANGAKWCATKIFSTLPLFAATRQIRQVLDQPAASGGLGAPLLVVASAAGTGTQYSLPYPIGFPAGLSLAGTMSALPLPAFFAPLVTPTDDPPVLAGSVLAEFDEQPPKRLPPLGFPWQRNPLPPGLNLALPLTFNGSFGHGMNTSSAGLQVYCPLTVAWLQQNPSFSPVFAVWLKMTIGSLPELELVGEFGRGQSITLVALFEEGASLSNGFAGLSALTLPANQQNFTNSLPDNVASTDSLGLDFLKLTLEGDTTEVTAFVVGVSLPSAVSIGPWTLSGVSLILSIEQPFGSASFGVTVQGEISFKDTISLGVEFDYQQGASWALYGALLPKKAATVTFGDLYTAMTGDTAPGWLDALALADIDITLTGTDDWSFDLALGSPETRTTSLTILGESFTLESMIFAASENSGKLDYRIQASCRATAAQTATEGADTPQVQYQVSIASPFPTLSAIALLPENDMTLGSILTDFGVSDPTSSLPGWLDFSITAVEFYYAEAGGTPGLGFAIGLQLASGVEVSAVLAVPGSSSDSYALILSLETDADLCSYPLIANQVKDQALTIESVGVIYVFGSNTIPAATLNALIDATERGCPGGRKLPRIADGTLNPGLTLEAVVDLGGRIDRLVFPLSNQPSPSETGLGATEQAVAATTAAGPSLSWMPIQCNLGPLDLQQIGFGIADSRLSVAVTASLTLGPLTLGLTGFGASAALQGPYDPSLFLEGLAVSFQSGSVTIDGALLDVMPTQSGIVEEYAGALAVAAEKFSLSLLGSYALSASGTASFMAFAYLQAAIGGPPFLSVTGLALGFGHNQSLILPPVAQIGSFPLVAAMADPAAAGVTPGQPIDIQAVAAALAEVTDDAPGDFWLAAGLTFTTYQLVNSQALAILDVGSELEIALLGQSSLLLPQTGNAYVAAILDLEATLIPDQGSLAFTALLSSSSYVLDPACHLTGGFAFNAWFDPSPQAGQFVVTLGGYSAGFTPPAYYPTVPRLGVAWTMSGTTSLSGGAYFALTPSMVMAGGSLAFVYQGDSVRAWFTAAADFAAGWAPFSYAASIEVSVGASITLSAFGLSTTKSVQVSAAVDLWGPPTGGQANLDLTLISVTVSFGPPQGDSPPLLNWAALQDLLPGGSSGGASLPAARRNEIGAGDPVFSAPVLTPLAGVLATILTGQVTAILLLGGGTGYPPDAAVTLSAPPSGGTQATATATIEGGVVTTLTLVDAGSGYTTPPAVTIAGGTGFLAAATVGQSEIRAEDFVLSCIAPVPVSSFDICGVTKAGATATIDIRPMGQSGLDSTLTVTVCDTDGNSETGWSFAAADSPQPQAMWGAPLGVAGPSVNDPPTLTQSMGLASLSPPAPAVSSRLPAIAMANLMVPEIFPGSLPISTAIQPSGPADIPGGASLTIIADTLAADGTAQARSILLDGLLQLGLPLGAAVSGPIGPGAKQAAPMTTLAGQVFTAYLADPLLGSPMSDPV